jgi:bifunctional enzyme CysN/CysC
MDLVEYSEEVSRRIEADYLAFAAQIGVEDVVCIPMSAVNGDNVFARSDRMPWYTGPALMDYLETVPFEQEPAGGPFRMPVQWVNRPNQDFRGFAGVVSSGTVAVGDRVVALPSARSSIVRSIVNGFDDAHAAIAGQAITIVLADELDVSRGDVLVAANERPTVADQFEATVIWMAEQPMLPGRSYLLKTSTQTVAATVAPLKYKVNVNTLEHTAAKRLELNDIGVCGLELAKPIVFEPYKQNRELGGFILIDRLTNATVGAGLLHFSLRRAHNVHWQALDVDRRARATQKDQKPCVLWFTGLSGAGKSTIANLLERRLLALGRHTYLLDGDNVRHGLNKDLGFTEADRVENIRRVAEVARLMADAGLIVLVSFISPFRAERRMARGLLEPGEFVEVFVDTPLAVAETRDPKGLYKKARRGELKNFTGLDSPYEAPENPELRIDTTALQPEEATEAIVQFMVETGLLESA